jgi:hypothetical protein
MLPGIKNNPLYIEPHLLSKLLLPPSLYPHIPLYVQQHWGFVIKAILSPLVFLPLSYPLPCILMPLRHHTSSWWPHSCFLTQALFSTLHTRKMVNALCLFSKGWSLTTGFSHSTLFLPCPEFLVLLSQGILSSKQWQGGGACSSPLPHLWVLPSFFLKLLGKDPIVTNFCNYLS